MATREKKEVRRTEEPDGVGYLKYSGDAVGPGIMDAGAAGIALTGLNETLRYFNSQQAPTLANIPYQIPVRIGPGSWEAIVLGGLGAAFAVPYLKTAATEMAKREFENVGLRDVFSKSMSALRHVIRLAKHTRRLGEWTFDKLKWADNNALVGIPGPDGTYEYFPAAFLEWYASLPATSVSKMALVVEQERTLYVATHEDGVMTEESITIRDKAIFVPGADSDDDSDYLFPDLLHGQRVTLEGRLTRGNAHTNSIGLEYEGHILNCHPAKGSIVKYKPALFLKCRVHGTVSRLGQRHVAEKRPSIIVERITPLEKDGQRKLL